MNETLDSNLIKGMVRRRLNIFLISFLVILAAGCITAYVWPPSYVSTSVILIENQTIPQEYVQTTITSFVEERLAAITQQVLSRSRLEEIIEEFDLYQDMRERYTFEEILEEMREDIHFEPRTAEVIDRRTGRPTEATIYFTLSYEGKDRFKVHKVAGRLANLYRSLNLKSREDAASTTTDFLKSELERLQKEMNAYDEKIGDFKSEHIGELPEYSTSNLQSMHQIETQLERLNAQINSLKDRKILLEGQLSAIDPLSPIQTADGKAIMNPGDRLKYLRMELISMGSRLSTEHPDYVRLKGEIEELEKHSGSSGVYRDSIKRLEALKSKLAEINGEKGEKHPTVIALKKEIDALSENIKNAGNEIKTSEIPAPQPDNPAYISLMTQITSTVNDINGLLDQKKVLDGQITEYKKMIANSPAVEKEYNQLMLGISITRQKYAEINTKLMEAEVAQGMEASQNAEKLSIIDPAHLPEKPASPNRIAIMLISLVLAMGFGTGLAAISENLDSSVKSREELQKLTGVPVFSVINRIETKGDKLAKRKKRIVSAVAIIVLITIGTIAFHNFVMRLEVFQAKLERKM